MVEEPTPPIFVIEGNDVGVYRGVADAERDIEPPDVEAGTYEGFDSIGRRLLLSTDGPYTRISLREPEVSEPLVLESKLRYYLTYLGEEAASDSHCDLGALPSRV